MSFHTVLVSVLYDSCDNTFLRKDCGSDSCFECESDSGASPNFLKLNTWHSIPQPIILERSLTRIYFAWSVAHLLRLIHAMFHHNKWCQQWRLWTHVIIAYTHFMAVKSPFIKRFLMLDSGRIWLKKNESWRCREAFDYHGSKVQWSFIRSRRIWKSICCRLQWNPMN